jgi:hypothetical protein
MTVAPKPAFGGKPLMTRYALMLCAGILIAMSGGCAPGPVELPPPAAPVRPPVLRVAPACQSMGISSGLVFVSQRVRVGTFFPRPGFGPLNPVPFGSWPVAGDPYKTDLAAAFEAAPQSFQAQLCGLDGVIVNTACTTWPTCTPSDAFSNSWGLRESKARNSARGGRYIAISATLWRGDHAVTFKEFEDTLFAKLSNWPQNQWRPSYTIDSSIDTPAMTVLASMAHEFGHVLWYDIMDPTRRGQPYDPNGFCDGNFFVKSWPGGVHQSPPRWRNFTGVGQDQHSLAIGDLLNDVNRQKWTDATNDVLAIYAPDAAWSSLFGAFAPDEDLVETFRLAVLRNARTPLQSLPLQLPVLGTTVDIPGTLAKRPGLLAKLSCPQLQVSP